MKIEGKRRKENCIQTRHLTWPKIHTYAEEFRAKYVDPIDKVPVPIVDIVEFDLGVHPIPIANLNSRIDIDGFLTKDLQSICIDQRIYIDDRYSNRLRFTFAHEVGHLVLHSDQINQCQFRTSEEWIHFHEDLDEERTLVVVKFIFTALISLKVLRKGPINFAVSRSTSVSTCFDRAS